MDLLLPRDLLLLGPALLMRNVVALLVGDGCTHLVSDRLAVGSVLHLKRADSGLVDFVTRSFQ